MSINIGINDKNRGQIGQLLNTILADEFVLYTKLRNYHWNVVGPHFSELHKFFESQYETIDSSIDEIAERARAVGEKAAGSMKDFLRLARIGEDSGRSTNTQIMLKNILFDHESIIHSLRQDLQRAAEKYGDMGTSDFLTGLMEEHEKMAWMVRSFLNEK